MSKRLIFIRHGQAQFDADDYDQLSPLGEQQSERVGHYLKAKNWDWDYCVRGTLKRHQQTLAAALPQQGKVIVDADWNELDHVALIKAYRVIQPPDPTVPDARFRYFQQAVHHWLTHDDMPGIETRHQFVERVEHALAKVIERTDQAAVVFTSGGPIAQVLRLALGLSDEQTQQLNFQLVNSGISQCVATSKGLRLVSMNEHHHLETEQQKHWITYR